MLRIGAIVLMMFLFSVAAKADNCPPLIELVDEILEMADAFGMDAATREEITELRNEAQRQHEAGDDRQCVITIDEALAIIEGDHAR